MLWPDDLAADLAAKREAVEKAVAIWGSPAGKSRLAPKLAPLLPEHATYVEPFAGSAAVLFNKPAAKVEALNDLDSEIADAFATIQGLTPGDLEHLASLDWTSDRDTWATLAKLNTANLRPVERLHRFLYLAKFSFGRHRGKSYDPGLNGKSTMVVEKLPRYIERLAGVKVSAGDYADAIKRYDSPTTVFYLDPPYAGTNGGVGEAVFDEARFADVLASIKGKFLLTYGSGGELPAMLKAAGYKIRKLTTARTISTGAGGAEVAESATTLVVTNYVVSAKAAEVDGSIGLGDGLTLNEWEGPPMPAEKHTAIKQVAAEAAARTYQIRKYTANPGADGEPDLRVVIGEVLVPEEVDAQGEIYSHEVVRDAAWGYLSRFGRGSGQGRQHNTDALLTADEVELIESYIAPVDFAMNGRAIKQGTWMMGWRILDDALWADIKAGKVTGFSIGGLAAHEPA